MYFSVYKITNLINNKIYIGVHKTDDLNDDYMGSGKYLKRAIIKYGVENFKKEYLGIFDNQEDMFEMESVLVNDHFVHDDGNYNLVRGGYGGWGINDSSEDHVNRAKKGRKNADFVLYKKYGEDFRRVISKLGSDSCRKFLYEQRLNKDFKERETKRLLSYRHLSNTPEANTKRKETFNKIKHQVGSKNSQFGTFWITNGKENKKIKNEDEIFEGWYRGRTFLK